MTSGPAALVVDGVSRSFGSKLAVDRVDLTAGPGELLALVGPSGCGKSTLLRLIAGLLRADRGRVVLAGRVVDDGAVHLAPEDRRVGLVFQEHALFPHLTAGENVGFGLRDLDRGARRRRTDESLSLVGLDGLADRYPHELSGGERQRVALARALAPEPALLLLDEPFASLDTNLRHRIRADVVDILRRTGTPAVFVTHEQNEALAVGDRVAVLREGRLLQLGTPWEVFHRPCDGFVAGFLGEADTLLARFDGAEVATPLGRSRADLPTDPAQVPPTGEVRVMVRPDDVRLVADPAGDARVVTAEFRGSAWVYGVTLPTGEVVRSERSHLEPLDLGAAVRAELVPGHVPFVLPG